MATGPAAIGASQQQASGNAPVNKFSNLSSQEFTKILFSELKNQDPLNPQDSTKMLQQISDLRNIESQMSLQEQMQNLVTQNQLASASNMIGKLVTGLSGQNEQVQGMVTSVRVNDESVMLELDTGQQLDMSRVTGISRGSGQAASAGA